MTPHVTVFADARQNHIHASSVYAGLDLLARRKLIRLTISTAGGRAESHLVGDPLTVCLQITRPRASARLIAMDLHDQSDVFALQALEVCDTYLKRSFERNGLRRLPGNMAQKIVPFGLNYPCRTVGSTVRFLWATGPALVRTQDDWYRRIWYQLLIPSVRQYEQSPVTRVRATIVFQTRVWDDHEAPGEAHSINERRVSLLRALRMTFGDRFIGGLVRTRLAIDKYPNDLTNQSSRRSKYVAMSKQNLIGIYSQGLWGSTAFKLPEYLAASQCIVAEPIHTELPQPLKAGTNYLPFQTIEQCIDACRRLLDDHVLAKRMRQANHEYYLSSVEPSARMARVVHIATADAS